MLITNMLIKEAGGLVLNFFRPDLFSMIAKEGSVHPFSFFLGARHTKLFLCRAQEADFQTEKFEYEVLEADRIVGRIYFNEKSVGRKWFWEISDFAGRGKYVQKGIGRVAPRRENCGCARLGPAPQVDGGRRPRDR